MNLKAIAVAAIMAATLSVAAAEESIDADLQLLADGYKSGNKAMMQQGIARLEKKANAGNASAAFNLSAYYSGVVTQGTRDDDAKCKWAMMAAKRNFVDAYSAAITCELRKTSEGNRAAVFDRDAIPWIRKMAAESKDPEEIKMASDILVAWDDAKRTRGPVTLGGLISGLGALTPPSDPTPKATAASTSATSGFVCTIYCNSSSGPTVRRTFQASSRKNAARLAGAEADSICKGEGHSKASALSLPERQCAPQ